MLGSISSILPGKPQLSKSKTSLLEQIDLGLTEGWLQKIYGPSPKEAFEDNIYTYLCQLGAHCKRPSYKSPFLPDFAKLFITCSNPNISDSDKKEVCRKFWTNTYLVKSFTQLLPKQNGMVPLMILMYSKPNILFTILSELNSNDDSQLRSDAGNIFLLDLVQTIVNDECPYSNVQIKSLLKDLRCATLFLSEICFKEKKKGVLLHSAIAFFQLNLSQPEQARLEGLLPVEMKIMWDQIKKGIEKQVSDLRFEIQVNGLVKELHLEPNAKEHVLDLCIKTMEFYELAHVTCHLIAQKEIQMLNKLFKKNELNPYKAFEQLLLFTLKHPQPQNEQAIWRRNEHIKKILSTLLNTKKSFYYIHSNYQLTLPKETVVKIAEQVQFQGLPSLFLAFKDIQLPLFVMLCEKNPQNFFYSIQIDVLTGNGKMLKHYCKFLSPHADERLLFAKQLSKCSVRSINRRIFCKASQLLRREILWLWLTKPDFISFAQEILEEGQKEYPTFPFIFSNLLDEIRPDIHKKLKGKLPTSNEAFHQTDLKKDIFHLQALLRQNGEKSSYSLKKRILSLKKIKELLNKKNYLHLIKLFNEIPKNLWPLLILALQRQIEDTISSPKKCKPDELQRILSTSLDTLILNYNDHKNVANITAAIFGIVDIVDKIEKGSKKKTLTHFFNKHFPSSFFILIKERYLSNEYLAEYFPEKKEERVKMIFSLLCHPSSQRCEYLLQNAFLRNQTEIMGVESRITNLPAVELAKFLFLNPPFDLDRILNRIFPKNLNDIEAHSQKILKGIFQAKLEADKTIWALARFLRHLAIRKVNVSVIVDKSLDKPLIVPLLKPANWNKWLCSTSPIAFYLSFTFTDTFFKDLGDYLTQMIKSEKSIREILEIIHTLYCFNEKALFLQFIKGNDDLASLLYSYFKTNIEKILADNQESTLKQVEEILDVMEHNLEFLLTDYIDAEAQRLYTIKKSFDLSLLFFVLKPLKKAVHILIKIKGKQGFIDIMSEHKSFAALQSLLPYLFTQSDGFVMV